MTLRALEPPQESSLVFDYRAGASLEALASSYGCAIGTARNVLIRHGEPRRKVGQPFKPLADTKTKTCSVCGYPKVLKDFPGNGKKTSECLGCKSKRAKVKYHTDSSARKKALDRARAWTEANPEKSRVIRRNWARLRLAGWTQEMFETAWRRQKGCCAICKQPMMNGGTGPDSVHADHDHKTGHARALLCAHCNRGLGAFKDSPGLLEEAALYLKEHSVAV